MDHLCVSDVSSAVLLSSIMLLSGLIRGKSRILMRGDCVSSIFLTPSLILWPIPCLRVVWDARNC